MTRPDPEAVRAFLEAFVLGDALGMPTEFMTRSEIRKRFGLVDRLLEPAESRNHPDLAKGRVTDDTEQVLALLDEYCLRGRIDARETAVRLLRWVNETGAIEKHYIGPSSKVALKAIEEGADPEKGYGGTTCGGIMRSPAAALFALERGLPLAESIAACLKPTHNSSPALSAACAYAFALHEALAGGEAGTIAEAAVEGSAAGLTLAPWEACAPSIPARLRTFEDAARGFSSAEDVLDFLYDVYGTGLEAVDVAAAALCIFLYAPIDSWMALRMGASVGGDTDTIAALAGGLSAAHRAASGLKSCLPQDILYFVLATNGIDLSPLIKRLGPEAAG
ncbi:MAG: ADP-ribosylglycohydrolase family protein [Spirochaetes bacterium]|nr:ADP-ribosylglycohydrolase family protein [Spirochaetota bacterium]